MLELCEVQDFYETLEMDNYVALSKRDTELQISLNECYATHTLLEKHNAELAKDPSSHLGIICRSWGLRLRSCLEKRTELLCYPYTANGSSHSTT